jgi:hypothetical protein
MAPRLQTGVRPERPRLRRILRQPARPRRLLYTHLYKDGTSQLRENAEPVEVEGYLTDLYNRKARSSSFAATRGATRSSCTCRTTRCTSRSRCPTSRRRGWTRRICTKARATTIARWWNASTAASAKCWRRLEKQGVLDDTPLPLLERQRRRAAQRQSPALQSQAIALGGRHSGAVPRSLARTACRKAKVVRQPAITMDLTATIAAACGASPLSPDSSRSTASTCCRFCAASNRAGRTHVLLARRPERPASEGDSPRQLEVRATTVQLPMLFNLENDVGERQDLGYRHPEILIDLERRLSCLGSGAREEPAAACWCIDKSFDYRNSLLIGRRS